ncbi:MAG: phosphotransferase [Pseudonocardia sp.]|nr:phosphotransferase [Pseudonocardia sp.]
MEQSLVLAERLLTRRYGATVKLADPEDLGGGSTQSLVLRVRVTENPFGLPRNLVIKHYQRNPTPGRADRFRHEAASCQLFTAMQSQTRPSSELFGYDPANRLLVLEDLGRSSTLADKLFGSDPDSAERCLLSWARALGRLHAVTAGREYDFDALLRRLGERSWRDPMADEARTALATVPELVAAKLGVTIAPAAAEEARATARLLGGTRYRAFSPSDTCPDNNLVTSKGVRFVDFEWGCFRDVMLDAAYTRVPFPACESSFALPTGMAEAMLAAWRSEVVAVWPDLDEPARLLTRLLDAQLLWVWLCTLLLLPRGLAENGLIGRDATRSPRALLALAHYWAALARDAAEGGRPASAELGEAMVAALRPRLAEEHAELPLYPAFRHRPVHGGHTL